LYWFALQHTLGPCYYRIKLLPAVPLQLFGKLFYRDNFSFDKIYAPLNSIKEPWL
jgi:hypothetical protein